MLFLFLSNYGYFKVFIIRFYFYIDGHKKQVARLWNKPTIKLRSSTLSSFLSFTPSSSLSSSATLGTSALGKKRNSDEINPSPSKKQCVLLHYFVPEVEVYLRDMVDILEMFKSAVKMFNKLTIEQETTRSNKIMKVPVDSKCNVRVPRESTYDVKMY